MSGVRFTLTGQQKITAYFSTVSQSIIERLTVRLNQAHNRLMGFIKSPLLTGDVLKNRTGALRRSIFMQPAQVEGTTLSGGVYQDSATVPYGPVHEFGFHGTVQVPAHTRTSSRGNPFQVRAYQMRMNLAERSFMRYGFGLQKPMIIQAMQQGVAEGLKKK